MDMQEFIDKYSPRLAQATLQRFREMDSTDTLYGRVFGSLNEVEKSFLKSLPKGFVNCLGREGSRAKVMCPAWYKGVSYLPAGDYTLPETPSKPEYFVGELKPLGLYSTPTAVDDWENETHDDILVSEYRDWAFLGFSWENPRDTDDWNAEHFAHLTPFAKGDDDEVVMAPYAVWRKKGE